jgi:hypothetical protein
MISVGKNLIKKYVFLEKRQFSSPKSWQNIAENCNNNIDPPDFTLGKL